MDKEIVMELTGFQLKIASVLDTILRLLPKALDACFTKKAITHSFRATGIYPFDRKVILANAKRNIIGRAAETASRDIMTRTAMEAKKNTHAILLNESKGRLTKQAAQTAHSRKKSYSAAVSAASFKGLCNTVSVRTDWFAYGYKWFSGSAVIL